MSKKQEWNQAEASRRRVIRETLDAVWEAGPQNDWLDGILADAGDSLGVKRTGGRPDVNGERVARARTALEHYPGGDDVATCAQDLMTDLLHLMAHEYGTETSDRDQLVGWCSDKHDSAWSHFLAERAEACAPAS